MTSGAKGNVSGARARVLFGDAVFLPDLRARSRQEALREMLASAGGAGAAEDPEEALRILLDREILGTTAVGRGVAIPHGRSMVVPKPFLAFARSIPGIAWDALDHEDVHLIFLLLAPDAPRWRKPYLEHLARLARVAALARNRSKLLLAPDPKTLHAILAS